MIWLFIFIKLYHCCMLILNVTIFIFNSLYLTIYLSKGGLITCQNGNTNPYHILELLYTS